MKSEDKKTSEGLNEIFEIINAKGDIGEIKEIVEQATANENSDKNHF